MQGKRFNRCRGCERLGTTIIKTRTRICQLNCPLFIRIGIVRQRDASYESTTVRNGEKGDCFFFFLFPLITFRVKLTINENPGSKMSRNGATVANIVGYYARLGLFDGSVPKLPSSLSCVEEGKNIRSHAARSGAEQFGIETEDGTTINRSYVMARRNRINIETPITFLFLIFFLPSESEWISEN